MFTNARLSARSFKMFLLIRLEHPMKKKKNQTMTMMISMRIMMKRKKKKMRRRRTRRLKKIRPRLRKQ